MGNLLEGVSKFVIVSLRIFWELKFLQPNILAEIKIHVLFDKVCLKIARF